jgi:hypothetical protein
MRAEDTKLPILLTIVPKADPSAESPDFYMENGYMVFTEAYHLRRGSCCGNGCRHCPYRSKREKK